MWARGARGDGGRGSLQVLEVDLIVIAQVAPVSRKVILIAKRLSVLHAGSRLAQCRIGLTKESGNIQSR